MLNPLIVDVVARIASQGIKLYQQMNDASADSNVTKFAAVIPILADLNAATQEIGRVLDRAQNERWTEDDPRWTSVFTEADKQLAAAESRLPKPEGS